MKGKLFRTTICTVLAAATLAIGALAAEVGSATVNATDVRVRETASTEGKILTVSTKDATVTTLGLENGWYKVAYYGKVGYMSADYLTPVEDAVVTAHVKGTEVRLRAGAGTDTAIVSVCTNGQELTVLDETNGWYHVQTGGNEGYILGDYVSFSAFASGEATEAALALVETAMQYLGTPYVYGGASPSGFDCSGFVSYVCAQNGISLKRTAYDQYYDIGEPVAYENLQPGDLLFFTNTWGSGIGHVGIYIGDGQFIHASSGTAYSVTISELGSAHYTARYVGAKRVA